ncbi:hypothetical protein [Paraburkholderia sp. DGU8]|uniref:hypothetical protein n=1 Tax=Paraburkholderia sp. DGU8 TaxID=3161997 RepID=UPI003466EA1E
MFPARVRSTDAALTYNLAVLLLGGLAPFIDTWLVKVTGGNIAPVYYVRCSQSAASDRNGCRRTAGAGGVLGAVLLDARAAR